ncbi:MAG: transglycosylase domain-containing protein [Polyangia bacterium]
MARERIKITNPADGGFFYWLAKFYLFAFLGLGLAVLHVLAGVYLYFARTLPKVPDFATYAAQAPGITQIFAGDTSLLAELASERREVVPLSQIPKPLIDAVLATEDRRFYEHRGLDLRGFVRAMRVNLLTGQLRQGGSTITQQVAKAFLSPERSLSRKIREAILARRMEARYEKREILSLYLNHIFLGHGSFGVQAAARRYFDRNVWELSVDELAMIAGLAKAPTRFSPLERPQAAQARRDIVLRNMTEVGYLTADEGKKLQAKPLALKPRRDASHDVSPYFVDAVRRELFAKLGSQRVLEEGLRVETTVQPFVDVLAAENVDNATRRLDKRQGWRGPEAHLDTDAQRVFLLRASQRYAGPLAEDTLYLGLVTAVRGGGATVQIGPHVTDLPLNNMLWAARYNARDSANDRLITSAFEALKPGDVIWVKLAFRSRIGRFSDYVYAPITPYKEGGTDGSKPAAEAARPAPKVEHTAPVVAAKPPARGTGRKGSRSKDKAPKGAVAVTDRGDKGDKAGRPRPIPGEADGRTAAAQARPVVVSRPQYVPGTGVWLPPPGEGEERRAGVPGAPGKRQEVGEAVWLPEAVRKPGPSASREVMLEQPPRPQGALYTFDLATGYVLAMAGGNDYDRSEFNRAVQACRQPGSAYKPVYYSLALDRGYSYDTMWNDKVKVEIDPVTGEQWVPTNIDGSYGQQVSLERALVWSKNPPSLEIFKTMGKKDVASWARRLGMTTPIHADDALALGASCVRVDEVSRSFALFARSGRPIDTVQVKRVLSRKGEVLIDNSAWDDPLLDGRSRLDRLVAMAGRVKRPVIPPRTAYLTGTLLRRVVSQGHSKPIRDTKIIAAGKTGTSSRTSDVWFVGFTSRWLTTAWVGDDTYERQLGYADASFTISVPMWARFMYHANHDAPLTEIPERPRDVKPTDRGGPILPGFPPPPSSGISPEGKTYELPENLRELPTAPKGSRPPVIF